MDQRCNENDRNNCDSNGDYHGGNDGDGGNSSSSSSSRSSRIEVVVKTVAIQT